MNSSLRLRRALAMGTNPQSGDLPLLIAQLGKEPDFFVRDMLTWAITRHPVTTSYPLLVRALDNPDGRSQVLHTLSKLAHPDTWSVITAAMLHDEDIEVRTTAWRVAVAAVPDNQVDYLVAELIQELGRGDIDTQRSLSRALASLSFASRNRVAALATHARHVLALMDNPDAHDELSSDFARKLAALGPDGQD
ncbi:HEAT repeat domain-containing protein [Corynebacterium ammoniagenes]|uniref:HEAT repeat domain-containing protein n=2 Tax=Corynebacterium ammoniagenes TaxID=1697 RepID=A0AAV5G669_CORAM|nr:HEAT repeat domain-containing protein [Corynebacterium ammoniagenes]APT82315.1 hypothetical protein CAMM_05100 [Corynebacterium ammoniagenes DSM 20306]AQS73404.1 hypothetical protein CA40472_05425 [Corynebacterium ammoniagenes]NMF31079.1 HEAT repeat domain-containing protein [Corynebacterium ammoniagenes]GJN42143.1 hypothetical protein CAT723_06220 [Corynebacterium ammoniagenes]